MRDSWILNGSLVLWTALSWIASMPPFNVAESAFIWSIPLLLWLRTRPDWKSCVCVSFCSAFIAYLVVFIWLRHVTYAGTLILSAYLSLYFVAWVVITRRLFPKLIEKSFLTRLLGACSIASVWVFFEWLRGLLLYGTPMAPLSLSQWQRPVMLQVSAWTGAYGVSFIIVFFNVCMTLACLRLVQYRRQNTAFRWFNADFYAGLIAILFTFFVFLQSVPKALNDESEAFRVAVVQPNFEPLKVWSAEKNSERLTVLKTQLQRVGLKDFDLLVLPESVSANPILGDYETLAFFEAQAEALQKPILTGNTAYMDALDLWYNGVFLVQPSLGLDPGFYAKRRLVPFGEYVPFPFDGLLEAFGASQGSFASRKAIALKPILLNGNRYQFGSLVCYEDMFPNLARASVLGGADILFVATNDAWYGEEGAAEFHAAHSVLRAVENRRPIIRSGNAGWSGWIDPLGKVRAVLTNEDKTVFFRGSGTFSVLRSESWLGHTSLYTQWGDWFVGVSALLGLSGYVCICIVQARQ